MVKVIEQLFYSKTEDKLLELEKANYERQSEKQRQNYIYSALVRIINYHDDLPTLQRESLDHMTFDEYWTKYIDGLNSFETIQIYIPLRKIIYKAIKTALHRTITSLTSRDKDKIQLTYTVLLDKLTMNSNNYEAHRSDLALSVETQYNLPIFINLHIRKFYKQLHHYNDGSTHHFQRLNINDVYAVLFSA